MHSNWWMNSFAVCELSLQIAAVTFILRSRIASGWRLLTASLMLDIVTYVACGLMIGRTDLYAPYFYTYWSTSALQCLLRLAIAYEVARSFPHSAQVPRSLKLCAVLFSSGLAASCVLLSIRTAPEMGELLSNTALLLNRSVNFAWLGLLIGTLGFAKLFAFGWSRIGAHIAAAISLRICATVIVAEVITGRSSNWRLASYGFESLCNIAVLLYICIIFLQVRRSSIAVEIPAHSFDREQLDAMFQLVHDTES